ncbi:hypothetical protein AB6F25_21950 [Vibrio splendidus]
MSNVQLLVQLLSWALLLYLHSRTLKRAELARVKDNLISNINDLSGWANDILQEKIPDVKLEDMYAGKVSSIELMVNQLNSHKHKEFISLDSIIKLRGIDIIAYRDSQKSDLIFEISSLSFELVSHIENEYYSHFYSSFKPSKMIEDHKFSILGATCGAAMIYFLFTIFSIMYA